MPLLPVKDQFIAPILKGLYPQPEQYILHLKNDFEKKYSVRHCLSWHEWEERCVPLYDLEANPKRMTIRAMRKRPFEVGDPLYIYAFNRTKNMLKLGEAKVKDVSDIFITNGYTHLEITKDVEYLMHEEIQELTELDGFKDTEDSTAYEKFRDFFVPKHRDEFYGQIIRW